MTAPDARQVTLVISTYNWKDALKLVLESVARQSRQPGEVIVADDGSREDTAAMLQQIAATFPTKLRHAWHADNGFRKARILNRAIEAARGEYLVQVDGDMVIHRHFIADHLRLAGPGKFLQGTRIRTTEAETRRLLAGGKQYFDWRADAYFRDDADRSTYHYGRRHHTVRIPWLAVLKSKASGHPMGCNVSFWRDDLLRVNGYDERMIGYGTEDLEIDLRLRHAGLRRSQIKFAALALHLEHRSLAPVDPSDPTLPNNRLMQGSADTNRIRAEFGIEQYTGEESAECRDLN